MGAVGAGRRWGQWRGSPSVQPLPERCGCRHLDAAGGGRAGRRVLLALMWPPLPDCRAACAAVPSWLAGRHAHAELCCAVLAELCNAASPAGTAQLL